MSAQYVKKRIKYQGFSFTLLLSVFLFCYIHICRAADFSLSTRHQNQANQRKHQQLFLKKNLHSIENEYISNNKKQHKIKSAKTSENAPWSNAFNFKKIAGTQVDPRTGVLSAHIKAGSLLSNSGHGPNIDLEVNYSSAATADPDGLGIGWSWNLTHFNTDTNQLTTSGGQTFNLQQKNNGQWFPLYHKLHDLLIMGDKKNHFVITYANGLRETLDHDGYEICLEQQDGWRVHFSYLFNTHLLQSVSDDEGHTIVLSRNNNKTIITGQGSTGQPASVLINKEKGELRNITLPVYKNQSGPSIYINYIGRLMTRVSYPTGLKKIFTYNCKNAMKYALQDLVRALCVISHEEADPGAGQPVMTVHYQYSQVAANEHNYLGFNAGLAAMGNKHSDILFEAPVSYTYRTQVDNGITREVQTYNKYHLLINTRQISDHTEKKLSEVQSFFCRIDKADGCAHSSFADLPSNYSQPLKIITQVFGNSAAAPALSSETMTYDEQGRSISHQDAYGRLTTVHYCPVTGDAACPKAPDDWPFSTLTESMTLFPAVTALEILSFSPVTTYNYYRKAKNLANSGYILVLDHQRQQAGQKQIVTTRRYYNDPDNTLTYGLLRQTILTGNISGPSRISSVIQDYYYRQSKDHQRKTTYSAIKLGSGKTRRSSYITRSLFTNHVLQSVDPSGNNITHYHYDLWDRPVQTDFAVGTPFAASNHYQYITSPLLNQVIITATNGLQQKVIFDSAGRSLLHFTEALSDIGKREPGHWQLNNRTTYDAYGRVAAQSVYIINASKKTDVLTTTQDYDDSGRVTNVHLPDGETAITLYDDATRCVVGYKESSDKKRSAISVMHANILYQPIKQWILPATENPLFSPEHLCTSSEQTLSLVNAKMTSTAYDGFGRMITVHDVMRRTTKKHYDEFGQVIDITDPLGNQAHFVYDLVGHVVQHWAKPVTSNHYFLLSSSEYNSAGDLLWQAAEGGKRTTFTYTTEGRLATITTPEGNIMARQYNDIGLPVAELLNKKPVLQRQYDPVGGQIKKQFDITGETTFFYDDAGILRRLIHAGKNSYPNYQSQWQYDKNLRVVSMTDIANNKLQKLYDSLGRIAKIIYQPDHKEAKTLIIPVYDGFSRTKLLHYGSAMQRHLRYDAFGRMEKMTDTLAGKLLNDWSFSYDAKDNITTLIQHAQQGQQAELNYQYDTLNNLVTMRCEGSDGLPLCPRDTAFKKTGLKNAPIITRQDYTFTPLNRLSHLKETLQDNLQYHAFNKTVTYHYSNVPAPLRLNSISTNWNNKTTQTQYFIYDSAGNMTTDGEGNHMLYNAFNQIMQVIKPDGKQSNYLYDGMGREIREKTINDTVDLFYHGKTLVNEQISTTGQKTHIIGYQGVAKTIDGRIDAYNESNYKGDIVGILTKASNSNQYTLSMQNIYSPYGMVWHSRAIKQPLYQQMLAGFDGERTDPATGWQFLGAGHRTYNPEQRYFVSEDPAGGGYGFASNNPIMNTDPSGNTPQWLGGVFKWMGYISTFGLNALHAKWAHIAGSVITAGLTVATLGAAAASYGGSLLAGVVMGGTAIAGSVTVVAAAIPSNKGLNIAASVIGFTEMAAIATTAAVDMGLFLLSASKAASQISALVENLALKEFYPLMMSSEANAILADNFYASTYTSVPLLMRYASDLITYDHLKINGFDDLCRIWSVLKSERNDLICCDTGALMVATLINKKPLSLSKFGMFLTIRKELADILLAPISYERFAIKLVTNRRYVNVFKSVCGFNRWVSCSPALTALTDVLKNPGNIALIMMHNHIQVVARLAQSFAFTYNFTTDNVYFQINVLSNIEQDFFAHTSDPTKQVILGYAMLGPYS